MIIEISKEAILQLHKVISQISSNDFNKKLPVLKGGTIGQHVRHMLEFYTCLFDGCNCNEINYDKRQRNLLVESNSETALDLIDETLHKLHFTNPNEEITLVTEMNGININITSTINRELLYLIEHNIHHYAILEIAIRSNFDYIKMPHNFGVAYSTIKHAQDKDVAIHH